MGFQNLSPSWCFLVLLSLSTSPPPTSYSRSTLPSLPPFLSPSVPPPSLPLSLRLPSLPSSLTHSFPQSTLPSLLPPLLCTCTSRCELSACCHAVSPTWPQPSTITCLPIRSPSFRRCFGRGILPQHRMVTNTHQVRPQEHKQEPQRATEPLSAPVSHFP